jgi:hypothetical protein
MIFCDEKISFILFLWNFKVNNNVRLKNLAASVFLVFPILILSITVPLSYAGKSKPALTASIDLGYPIIITQLPLGTAAEKQGAQVGGTLRANYGEGGRLVLVSKDMSTRVLSKDFHSASDPAVSFDGRRLLFAGKRKADDKWNIYEKSLDRSTVRQVTDFGFDCRSPGYQSAFYTIVSPKPWYQITFVGTKEGVLNEYGEGLNSNLYSCKLDGNSLHQLTYNLSSDMDPYTMQDGRILYASWQSNNLKGGTQGRISLFGINTDGTDNAGFSIDEGKRIKYMPCVTTDGLAVFVEGREVDWDGAGNLGAVTTRRPLHSYREITKEGDGLFHSPSSLPYGKILVSRRSSDDRDTHAVCVLDPMDDEYEVIFDDPEYHDIQAKAVYAQRQPDGRSSIVKESDAYGKLYCLNVYNHGLGVGKMGKGSVKILQVFEGILVTKKSSDSQSNRRLIGEVPVSADGSFNLEVPANIPLQLQLKEECDDCEGGRQFYTCSWIWVKNHESRGCIGCHEDGELTPENRFVEALKRHSIKIHSNKIEE